MYFSRRLGWLGPSGSYTYYHTSPFKVFYKKWLGGLLYVFTALLLVASVLLGMNFKARSLVVYEPAPVAEVSAASLAPPEVAPVSEVPETPLVIPPPPPDAGIQAILDSWVASHPGQKWSVVVRGLKVDTRFAQVNQDNKYPTASVYKLFLTYPLFKLETQDTIKEKQVTFGGKSYNLGYCTKEMLRASSNACGHAVGEFIGWSRADEFLHQVGFTGTTLGNPNDRTTTAADGAKLLEGIYTEELFSAADRNYIIDLLARQIWRNAIPAGCNSTCTLVADKPGYTPYPAVFHDMAIIEHAGGAYVLSIFTSNASPWQIAQLTRQVHQYMSTNPTP